MKSISKIFVGVAAAAALAVVTAPAAHAQCGAPQNFASIGQQMTLKQISVNTAGTDNTGKEIGRFWVSNDSTRGNNFGGTCASNSVTDPWWDLCGASATSGCAANPTFRGINGAITGGSCLANTCPDLNTDQMTFIVEEWGPGGPPGIGGTAFWIGFRVDATPSNALRPWDLSRITGNPPVNTTLNFLEFPTPQVTGSTRNLTGGVDTTNNYVDIGLNMHSATGASNTALPDNATIVRYDLCTIHQNTDPGRLRSAGWSCGSSAAYNNGAVSGHPFKVPCSDILADTWVAIGITFDGGSGPDVPSALVGRAIRVECDPNLAEPEPLTRPGVRPTPKKATSKPVRSGR